MLLLDIDNNLSIILCYILLELNCFNLLILLPISIRDEWDQIPCGKRIRKIGKDHAYIIIYPLFCLSIDIRSKNSDNYVIAIVLTQLYIILERTGDILKKGLC